MEDDHDRAEQARAEALAFYGKPRRCVREKRVGSEALSRLAEDIQARIGGAHRGPLRAVSPAGLAPSASTEGTTTMVSPAPDGLVRTPHRKPRPAAVLGAEIDHLRLYGINRRDIATRLRCSIDAVDKWVKAHPEPRESWEVSA